MLMVGAGVDYSRAARIRTMLQDMLDATGLMLARTPSIATYSAAQLQTLATTYFNAQFNPTDAANSTVTAAFDPSTMTISLTGATAMNTRFMQLTGIPQMNIGANSSVTWGITRLRVVLVLDNTGSMNDSGKIDALKTASHQLLTQLQNIQKAGGDVQVAIVPFTTDVNISKYADGNTTWIDWSQWSPSGSIENGMTCGGGGGFTFTWNGYTFTWGGGWGATCGGSNHSAWNGCVMDRTQPYDAQNTAPTSSAAYFPDQSDWCPAAMMALSTDWTALNNKIDAMTPQGNTNQTIGLAWGWQTLTQGLPLTAPAL
jgi:Flp pilus assembly protein TadG